MHPSQCFPASSSIVSRACSSSGFNPLLAQAPTPISSHISNKQRSLDSIEHDRLKNLLEGNFRVGRYETTLSHFLSTLLITIQYKLNCSDFFTQIILKGGATNHVLLGDRISYSDIDIGVELNPHISLADIKAVLHAWSVENGIKLKTLKLIPQKFLIITFLGLPKDIDVQFTLSCPYQSTCSYNSLRIDFFPTLHGLKKDLSIFNPPKHATVVFTDSLYPLDMALTDLKEDRSQALNPLEIFEGLRAQCRLLTKGIIPRSLVDEVGFTKGLEAQYSEDNYQSLQFSLLQFLPRHFTENSSLIIYLLNYESVIKRSSIREKATVQYYLVSLILDHMGCCENHFKEPNGFINIKRIENFINYCYAHLNTYFKGQETYSYIGDIKFCRLSINAENSIYLVIPKLRRSDRERLLETPLDPLNEKYLIRFIDIFNRIRPLHSEAVSHTSPQLLSEESERPRFNSSSVSAAAASPSSYSDSTTSDSSYSPDSQLDHFEIVVAKLGALNIPVKERAQEASNLFKVYSLLSTAQRKAHIEYIKAILNQLIEENLLIEATQLFTQLLKTRSYEKIEALSTPLSQTIINKLWVSFFSASKAQESFQIPLPFLTAAVSFFQLLFETPKIPEKLLKELSLSFPELPVDVSIDKKLIELLIDTLQSSKNKLNPLTQRELRNKILKVISSPAAFTITLDILWNKFQAQSEANPEIYYIELKRIVLQFIENIFLYPEEVPNSGESKWEYITKLFSNFLQTYDYQPDEECKLPLIDDLFIKNMTPCLYLSIQNDLFKLPFERFQAFYQALLHAALSLEIIPQQILKAIELGAIHLQKQSEEDESNEEIALKILKEPILLKFPVLKAVFKKQLKKIDQRDIFEKLKDVLSNSVHLLEEIKISANPYRELRKFLITYSRSSQDSLLNIVELDELFEKEEKRLHTLITEKSQASSKVKLENTLSELIEAHLVLLITISNDLKSALSIFRTSLGRGWLKLDHFKSAYTHLCSCSISVEDSLPELTRICKASKISEFFQFYRALITVRVILDSSCKSITISNPEDLKVALSDLVRLKQLNPKELREAIENFFQKLKTILARSPNRETIKHFEYLKPLLTTLSGSSNYVTHVIDVSQYMNALKSHFDAIESKQKSMLTIEDNPENQKDDFELNEQADWCRITAEAFSMTNTVNQVGLLQMAISLLEETRRCKHKLLLGNLDKKRVGELSEEIKLSEKKLKESYRNLVGSFYAMNNVIAYTNALQFYQTASLLYPDSKEAQSLLYPALHVPEISSSRALKAQVEPIEKLTNIDILYTLAEVHAEQKNFHQATAHFEKAYHRNTIDPSIVEKYCILFTFLKKWDKALFYFKKTSSICHLASQSKSCKSIEILELIIKWTQKHKQPLQEINQISCFSDFLTHFLTTPGLNTTDSAHSLLSLLNEKIAQRALPNSNMNPAASPLGAYPKEMEVKPEDIHEKSIILGFAIYQIIEELNEKDNSSLAFELLTKSLEVLPFDYFFDPCLSRGESFVTVILDTLKKDKSGIKELMHLSFIICTKLATNDPKKFEAYKEAIFEKINQTPQLLYPEKSELLALFKKTLEFNEENISIQEKITQASHTRLHLIDLQVSIMLMEAFHWRSPQDIAEQLPEKTFQNALEFIEYSFKNLDIPLLFSYRFLNLNELKNAFRLFNKMLQLSEQFFQTKTDEHLKTAFDQLQLLNRIPITKIEIKHEIINFNIQWIGRLMAHLSSASASETFANQKIFLLYIFNNLLQTVETTHLMKQLELLKTMFTEILKFYKQKSEQSNEARELIAKAMTTMGALNKRISSPKEESNSPECAPSASASSSIKGTHSTEMDTQQTFQNELYQHGSLELQQGLTLITKAQALMSTSKEEAIKTFKAGIITLESASHILEPLRQHAQKTMQTMQSDSFGAFKYINSLSVSLSLLYSKLEAAYIAIDDVDFFQKGLLFFNEMHQSNPSSNEILSGIAACSK